MKSHVNTFALSTLLASAAAFTSPASANPMTLELTFDTSSTGTLFPAGSDSVNVHYQNSDSSVVEYTSTTTAGMFSGVAGDDTTIDVRTLFTDPGNVLAYCVDLLQPLQRNATYDVETLAQDQIDDPTGVARNFGRMLSFLGAVNQVQQTDHGFVADSKNWLRPSTSWMSGAIQVGIWESLYEYSGRDLSVTQGSRDDSQWFWVDTPPQANNGNGNGNGPRRPRAQVGAAERQIDASGLTFLNKAFDLVNDGAGFSPVSASEVLLARNLNGQDVIVDPVEVPLPASGFLFFSGLGALAWRRREQ